VLLATTMRVVSKVHKTLELLLRVVSVPLGLMSLLLGCAACLTGIGIFIGVPMIIGGMAMISYGLFGKGDIFHGRFARFFDNNAHQF
jgi:hypothetical protein